MRTFGFNQMKRQDVFFNGRFLTQHMSGVQRYAYNIFSEMINIVEKDPTTWKDLKLNIATPSNSPTAIPTAFSVIPAHRGRLKGYPWEQVELPLKNGLVVNLCNLAPIFGRKNVVCIHDVNTYLFPDSYSMKYRAFQRISVPLIGRTASTITTVSHSSANALKAVGALRKSRQIIVAPNGHEHALEWSPDKAKIDLTSITRRPFVLMIGSAALHKNIDLVRRIAPYLSSKGIDCLVTGSSAAIYTSRSNIETDSIISIGYVDDNDISLLLSKAICLLFPSYVEGFGLPIVEAMAVGCPVISSNQSCMPEICGGAAILLSPDDHAAWIEAIIYLSSNSEARLKLISSGFKQVKKFSWSSSALIYLNIIINNMNLRK